MSDLDVREVKLQLRYPESRQEDITDAYMRGYKSVMQVTDKLITRLNEENAKLRKLVDGWEFCSNTRRPSFDECVGCPLFVQTPHSYRCARNECMRELGVDE